MILEFQFNCLLGSNFRLFPAHLSFVKEEGGGEGRERREGRGGERDRGFVSTKG